MLPGDTVGWGYGLDDDTAVRDADQPLRIAMKRALDRSPAPALSPTAISAYEQLGLVMIGPESVPKK